MLGVVTRRTLLYGRHDAAARVSELLARPPVCTYMDSSLREAADLTVRHDIGRLPVLDRTSSKVAGFITRSDLLRADRVRLAEAGVPAHAS